MHLPNFESSTQNLRKVQTSVYQGLHTDIQRDSIPFRSTSKVTVRCWNTLAPYAFTLRLYPQNPPQPLFKASEGMVECLWVNVMRLLRDVFNTHVDGKLGVRVLELSCLVQRDFDTTNWSLLTWETLHPWMFEGAKKMINRSVLEATWFSYSRVRI